MISTVNVSAVVSMRFTLRSEKLIPLLQNQLFVLLDDVGDLPQIVRPESVIDRQPRGRQPEFGIKPAFCNVNVRRLVAFFGIEIKLVAVNSQYRWHSGLMSNSSNGGKRLLNPRQHAFFAEDLEQVVEAGAGGFAGHGQSAGMHQHTGFHAQRPGGFLERGFQRLGVERGGVGKGVAEFFEARFVLRHEIFFGGLSVVFNRVGEIEAGVGGQFAEGLDLAPAGVERGFDVVNVELVGINARLGERVDGEFVETVAGQFAAVFALQPDEFLKIELGVVPENLREVEAFDDFGERNFFEIILGRPAEQAEVIVHGFGQKTFVEIRRERGAAVALAHLAAVGVQDERDVRILGRLDAEGAEEGDVLGGVAQMIFAANDVRDAHFEIVHDVDKMKHGLAVGADDDEVGINFLAVGERPQHVADDKVGDQDGFAGHLEFRRAFVFVGEAAREQGFDAGEVIGLALDLEIRATVALARAGGVGGERAFVPIQTEPAESAQDDLDGLLRIARSVGVLDAEDERAAGVPGVKPVEQSGARTADVQITGGRRGESDARFHRFYLTADYADWRG